MSRTYFIDAPSPCGGPDAWICDTPAPTSWPAQIPDRPQKRRKDRQPTLDRWRYFVCAAAADGQLAARAKSFRPLVQADGATAVTTNCFCHPHLAGMSGFLQFTIRLIMHDCPVGPRHLLRQIAIGVLGAFQRGESQLRGQTNAQQDAARFAHCRGQDIGRHVIASTAGRHDAVWKESRSQRFLTRQTHRTV